MSAPVRISDLIQRLLEWHKRFGNCPVYVEDTDAGLLGEVEHVEFDVAWSSVTLTVSAGWDE